MSIPGSHGTHGRVDRAVEVLNLVSGVSGRPSSSPNADQGLSADKPAELHDLFQPWPGRLKPPQARKGFRLSGSPTASRQSNSPRFGIIQRAAAEPDDSRLQRPDRLDDIARQPPTASSGMRLALSNQSVPGPWNSIVRVTRSSVPEGINRTRCLCQPASTARRSSHVAKAVSSW